MKQKLLFVIPSLSVGGGEKSLVNLLRSLDYSRFDVDLFLFHHEGLFMDMVPKQVRILPHSETYRIFSRPLHLASFGLLKKKMWSLAFRRLLYSIVNRAVRHTARKEQYTWRYVAAAMDVLPETYDAAIGYLEKTSIYFCVDKVHARQKWGWVHTDYDEMGMDAAFDAPYFRQLHVIATVSEKCASVLRRRFPQERDKIHIIYNIVSESLIHQMADAKIEDDEQLESEAGSAISLVSIGRLHPQKGFELAIEACRLLVDRGYNVKWSVIGEGAERKKLERMIRDHRLEQHFRLLGIRANPYPYIKQAMVYVHPSRYEGKTIAVDEAKILHKPIVLTNFSTAPDQIQNEVNGLIVPMHAKGVADGIERLMNDGILRARLTRQLSLEQHGTDDEVYKFYSLMQKIEEVS